MATKLQQAKRQARLMKARAEVDRAEKSYNSAKNDLTRADRLVELERAKSALRKLTKRKRSRSFLETFFG
jgi:hypothetical protein